MALANVADVFARRGLKTAMVDFDLEAPGLERFFLIDPAPVRRNAGLVDLLLAYKQAMSFSPVEGQAEFRRLDNFLYPIYRQLPSGGTLDLLPAGQRGDDEQLATYAYHLRTFDWQEFYFEWFGEVFFQWLRRELLSRYDVILVDSRTGMTEMGGVCAYQLADHMVMFCAANFQNVQGTRDIIRNFQSPRVRALRKDRPLDVLVVPARVQQNSGEVERFHAEFDRCFAAFTPPSLASEQREMWNLMLPYEAAYAFEERIVTANGDRSELRTALERLAGTVAFLATADSRLRSLGQGERAESLREPAYDPTRHFAGYDFFVSYSRSDDAWAERIAGWLEERGFTVWLDLHAIAPGEPLESAIQRGLDQSRAFVVLLGSSDPGVWWQLEVKAILNRSAQAGEDFPLIPVLLPGTTSESIPLFFRDRTAVDFRAVGDEEQAGKALDALVAAARKETPTSRLTDARSSYREVNPYRGLAAYAEEDARYFFGREPETARAIELLRQRRFVAIVGPSGSGKSSVVLAGIIPRLRMIIPNIRVIIVRPGSEPIRNLAAALRSVRDISITDTNEEEIERQLLSAPTLSASFLPDATTAVLVIDQLEELFHSNEQPAFLQAIRSLIGPAYVIATLRADFYGLALQKGLLDLLSVGQINLGPLSRDALREAIERPALSAGLAFEPGLVERLLDDAQDSPASLPLLQAVLAQMWHRSQQGFLTHRAYDEVGTVRTAIAMSADATYDSVPPAQQRRLRSVFLRMISPDGHVTPIPIHEFNQTDRMILDVLAERSLVFIHGDGDTATVAIAHQMLIENWPRLVRWVDEAREQMRFRSRIRDAALNWESSGRDRDFLYRGRLLEQAEALLRDDQELLGRLEREFLWVSARAEGAQWVRLLKRWLRRDS
jgi:hypothetical protein